MKKYTIDNPLVYQLNAAYGWNGSKFRLVCITKGAAVLQRRKDAKRFVLQLVTFVDKLASGLIKPLVSAS